jgi:hypothetical protein
MKSYLKIFAAFGAACFLTIAAVAADATPAGTWKWTQPGRGDRPAVEMTVKLDYQDGKLTGTLLGFDGPMGKVPDVAIADASFKEGAVAFSVTREFNGNSVTTKYEAKLDGDTLKGSTERPGRDGGAPVKRDWNATRAK